MGDLDAISERSIEESIVNSSNLNLVPQKKFWGSPKEVERFKLSSSSIENIPGKKNTPKLISQKDSNSVSASQIPSNQQSFFGKKKADSKFFVKPSKPEPKVPKQGQLE